MLSLELEEFESCPAYCALARSLESVFDDDGFSFSSFADELMTEDAPADLVLDAQMTQVEMDLSMDSSQSLYFIDAVCE